ncbi:aminotransferase class V-fold PLP-dependent enzyme [Humisphaera borealis]|uniref:Aminotransferase class V-fold PLP-dependent enzyme n=1 Tax=Humisphaera borealis TaxID=2807512 RepID=A0A7M2WTW5_9BACT|nr:aminotransferase class V-fold PLP-dependent enzyme [Humisphaera borealis]QOV88958.1 aminotransferase class V-fold PLP-dependent enzyme [Humisphaera borealis]
MQKAPAPLAPDLRSLWQLKSDVTFLNHGSFGAVAGEVAAVADDWRRRIEAEPIELLGRKWRSLLDGAVAPVAAFLNAATASVGFVTNATEGVNCVLRSLRLLPGDELLTTNHVYHAVRQAMKYTAAQSGAVYREVAVPLPLTSAEDITSAIVGGLSDRTKLLVLDHITSPTAIVFPIEAIAKVCKRRGVALLVDGAHAPGMVPLDLTSLGESGVTYYTGNLHKWCCAPKGTAFVWARADIRDDIHPAVVSHWYGDGFAAEFHWQGTRDHSGWLSAGAAIDFLGRFGWDNVRRHNHQMATWAHDMLCQRLNVTPVSPLDGSLLGSMATVPLPAFFQRLDDAQFTILQQSLYTDFRIEVPLVTWNKQRFVRAACQIYNVPHDYERLADVLNASSKS